MHHRRLATATTIHLALQEVLADLRKQGVVLVEEPFWPGEEPWSLDASVGEPIRSFEILREGAAYLLQNGSSKSLLDAVEHFKGSPQDTKMLRAAARLPAAADESGRGGSSSGGHSVTAWEYTQALTVHRPRLTHAFEDYCRRHRLDAIIYPTTHLPTQALADDGTVYHNGQRLPTYATYTRNTAPTSNAGVPALSLAVGMVKLDGEREAGPDASGVAVPVGMEVAGPLHSDERVLAIGCAIQELLPPVPRPVVLGGTVAAVVAVGGGGAVGSGSA